MTNDRPMFDKITMSDLHDHVAYPNWVKMLPTEDDCPDPVARLSTIVDTDDRDSYDPQTDLPVIVDNADDVHKLLDLVAQIAKLQLQADHLYHDLFDCR
jgi:hypothetical protein